MQKTLSIPPLCANFTNIYCAVTSAVGFSVSTGLPCSSKPGGVGIVLCAMVFYLVIELETAEILPAASEATAVIIVPTARICSVLKQSIRTGNYTIRSSNTFKIKMYGYSSVYI
jgi:hypothetical protein